ncbi:MAG: radical SAM protein [Pseudomonadota bacterium]
MKILFIYPNMNQVVHYHHGIASLSAVLKKAGHEVSLGIIHNHFKSDIKNHIFSYPPDLIFFSIVSNYWEFSCDLARKIKKDVGVKIFAGGMHCSIFPESYDPRIAFDGICLGEGEDAILDLVGRIERNEDYHTTRNFWFKVNGEIITNPLRPLIQDLDHLPFPDRGIFPRTDPEVGRRFIFSRGCPFNCTYCSNEAYRRLYQGQKNIIRYRSVHKAISEIKRTAEEYRPRNLAFDDDSFNKNRKWFLDFCDRYREYDFPAFECNTRPELINEETVVHLKEAGCEQINIGVESGDETIRKEILNRPMTDKQIIEVFRLAKRHHLRTYSFNMIGIPGERWESHKKTVILNRIIKPDRLQISIYYPYPGTKLEQICREKNLLKKRTAYNYFYEASLSLPGFSSRNILMSRLLFRFHVYRVISYRKAFYYLYRDLREYLEADQKGLKTLLDLFFGLFSPFKKQVHRKVGITA